MTKIGVTYLWADPSIMLDDFTMKASEKMTEWAMAFYAKYGFELDIVPKPMERKSVDRASKYILTRDRGVMPDLRDDADASREDHQRIAELNKQYEAVDADQARIKQQVDSLGARADRLTLDRDRIQAKWIAATDPTLRQQLKTQLDAAQAVLDQARTAHDQRWKEYMAKFEVLSGVNAKIMALYDKIRLERMNRTGEYKLRYQMAQRFKRDKIGDDVRVNIVFCKVVGWLGMRDRHIFTGNTFPKLVTPIIATEDGTALWPYTFIVIDLSSPEMSVAHELVHVPGRGHPPAMTVYTSLEKKLAKMVVPKGSLGGAPFSDLTVTYEEYPYQKVPGGYWEGQANDIMNYTLNADIGPETAVLSDQDKKDMDAYFAPP